MDRAEVVDLVRDALGFNKSLAETIILRHLDRVQQKYERGQDLLPLPWFLLDFNATVTTSENVRQVALPANFLSFDENYPLSIQADGKTYPLVRKHLYTLQPDLDLIGFPTHFETDNTNLYMFPIPDKAYTILVPCYRAGGKLSETPDSPWFVNFPDLMIEETAFALAKATRYDAFMRTTDINDQRRNYITRVEAQKHLLVQYQLGGSGA